MAITEKRSQMKLIHKTALNEQKWIERAITVILK